MRADAPEKFIGVGLLLIGDGLRRLQKQNAEMLAALEKIADYSSEEPTPGAFMRTVAEAAILKAKAPQP